MLGFAAPRGHDRVPGEPMRLREVIFLLLVLWSRRADPYCLWSTSEEDLHRQRL